MFDSSGASSTAQGAGVSPPAGLVAGLGVIGVSITAAAALVAALVKQSIDNRNHQLALDAEAREREALRLHEIETVMRAVAMLDEKGRPEGDSTSGGSSKTSASGAILALGALGQIRLALTLLIDLWPDGGVSSTAVDDVVERAFAESDDETQRLATQLLLQNVDRLDIGPGLWVWPRPLQTWNNAWSAPIKRMLVGALDQWLGIRSAASDDFRLALLRDASRDNDNDTRVRALDAQKRRSNH